MFKCGQFVAVDNKFGIGKLIGIDGNKCSIQFFIDISRQITEVYDLDDLQIVYLNLQTRVYFLNELGQWNIGRVQDYDNTVNPLMDYLVRFPNHQDKWLSAEELKVRCLLPNVDPTDVLSISGGETQYFYDSRKKVFEWLINLRASSRGLTALTSASIDLVVHQINVARKILMDPIQRYLLSDEVGMGKTIEAGIIARQCLLDDPNSKVLIVVPRHLISKWEHELYDKFYFSDFEDRFEIISPEAHDFEFKNPDLIIIDEAHHIVGDKKTYKEDSRENIIKIAKSSKKLLLLSATPGIGNEEILLNLLKVLDPIQFKSETLETFKVKVTRQTEQGTFLRTLKSNQSLFLLKRNLPKVSDLFPNDQYAEDLKKNIIDTLEDDSLKDQRLILIQRLRTHLVETWRLHNRLIRTRRIDSEGWEFQDRGDKSKTENYLENITIIEHPNKIIEEINLKIEDWRNFISLKNNFTEEQKENFIQRYILLLEKSNADISTFTDEVNKCIRSPIINGEVYLLEEILSCILSYQYEENLNEICREIYDYLNTIHFTSVGVVFISDITLAQRYFSALQNIFSADQVVLLDSLASMSFNSKFRIIICSEQLEEGVDLQYADAIIHLDLPINPSRVEQRIGRLDRYGRTKSLKIQHFILMPTQNTSLPWMSWFELLLRGFKLFHEPISDIQLRVEQITLEIKKTLFLHGVLGLEHYFDENNNIAGSLIHYINSIASQERELLDEQYALNHLSLQEGESLNIRDEIEDSECDEKSLEKAIDNWLFDALKFYKYKISDKIFELRWAKQTLVPKQQYLSKDNIVATDMWLGKFELAMERKLSYFRKESVINKDVSLLRPGHPLFYTLQEYMEWEDRGTAFSTFRIVNENFPIFIPFGEIRIIFKLHFIVESGLTNLASENISYHELFRRRTDDYFPPKIFIVYVDENMRIVEDTGITDILDQSYDKSIDTNLSSRRGIIDHFIDADKLDALCKRVSKYSKDILLNSMEYQAAYDDAISKAKIEIDLKCINIKRRQKIQEQMKIDCNLEEYDKLIMFEESIIEGIRSPIIKLDSFGMFFLSRFPIDAIKDINE